MHPGGAPEPVGVIIAVTPWGIAIGEAFTAVRKTSIASVQCMTMVLYVQRQAVYMRNNRLQAREKTR